MKAWTYQKYGAPEVLTMEELPAPTPGSREIVVESHALSLNPAEWHIMTGKLLPVRLSSGVFKPKQNVLGADVSGIIVAVGDSVKKFQVGDRVFGRTYSDGLAHCSVLHESNAVSIPSNISFLNAAASPLAALTALQALQHKANVQSGERVFIHGASGGIGTFAIQLANYLGAHVTAVCSTKNVGLVKSLGASEVIDYTSNDLTVIKTKFDVILDLVGNLRFSAINDLLSENGRSVYVGFSGFGKLAHYMIRGTLSSKRTDKSFLFLDTKIDETDLRLIGNLISMGTIKPVIDRMYDFDSVPEAFTYLGTRRVAGKLVVNLKS